MKERCASLIETCSRLSTTRTDDLDRRQQLVHVLQAGEQLLAGANTSSHGIGTPTTRWMIGPPSLVTLRPIGAIFSIHHRRLGQRQEAQRLAGRRRVDDDHVVAAGVDVVGDPQQVAELVHARQDRHLLGHHLVQPAPAQDRSAYSWIVPSSARC